MVRCFFVALAPRVIESCSRFKGSVSGRRKQIVPLITDLSLGLLHLPLSSEPPKAMDDRDKSPPADKLLHSGAL